MATCASLHALCHGFDTRMEQLVVNNFIQLFDCHSAGPSYQLPTAIPASTFKLRALANNQRVQSEWKRRRFAPAPPPPPALRHATPPSRARASAPARPRPRPCELKSPPAPAPCTLAPHAPGSPRVSCRCSGGPRDESETAGLRNNRTVARGCWRYR